MRSLPRSALAPEVQNHPTEQSETRDFHAKQAESPVDKQIAID